MLLPTDLPQPLEVVVVGAGAAGLLASIRSAERGRRTFLVEKNRKAGAKILMSGGTRCNITHDCDEAGIIEAFGSAGAFLHSALAALGPRELIELLESEGLETKVEPGGKVFPTSDRALDVLRALMRRLERTGATISLDEAVVELRQEGDCFCVETSRRKFCCHKVIVTSGGKSYSRCGTSGDGYRWLSAMGHTIRRPRPALVPLTTDASWVRELSGITIHDAVVRVVDAVRPTSDEENRPARRRGRQSLKPGVRIERRGAVLFTHFGLSGPAVLDVSRAVTGASRPRDVLLSIDFFPDVSVDAFDRRLREAAIAEGKRLVASWLAENVPRRLVDALMETADVPLDRKGAELSKIERASLVRRCKQCEIALTGSRGFDKAEVTAGGVALDEIDSRTMESKLVKNLYLAGEILDLDGFIGGYNFQAAFSTGWLAGESV